EEVQMIADRVTVFRDGRLVGTGAIGAMDNAKIIRMMIGRDFVYQYRGRLDAYDNEVVLKAVNISSRIHGFDDMSFEVHKGEILGFYLDHLPSTATLDPSRITWDPMNLMLREVTSLPVRIR
ncbi:MAG TPA: hypothetical protein PLW10_18775, partial [Myxococcota bacterium]|nr:hypothetical protein [Myxococcota bacterium]